MRIVTTTHTEIAVSHPITATWRGLITGVALPGRRPADRIRSVASIEITSGGAGALLSNLILLIPEFG